MRRAATLLLVLGIAGMRAAAAQSTSLDLWADLVARGVAAKAPPSWLAGATGRLPLGDDRERWRAAGVGEAQLGLDWRPAERVSFHLHARGRAQEDDRGAAGVVEAWAQATAMPRGGADRLRLRAGQLFLPTSRENVGPLWSTPYTFTLSALNSWIGEEVRPLGLLAEYEAAVDAAQGVRVGACAFGGNDASGALLAWRGWAMGDRLSTLGETLPLPPLPSLAPGGPFAAQDRDGTRPFGSDLDGRLGWAGYLRYRRSDVGLAQWTHVGNRGDRDLHGERSGHGGEYAWDTRFDLLGMELQPAIGWTFAAEHLRGGTAMGLPEPRADVDFLASYLLASWQRGAWRVTGRWDRFTTRDRDRLPSGEWSDEDGHAWTAALLWQALPALGVGLEYVDSRVARAALAGAGRRRDGGRALTVGLRCRLGSVG